MHFRLAGNVNDCQLDLKCESKKFEERITLSGHFPQYLTNVLVFGHPPGALKSIVRMTETC